MIEQALRVANKVGLSPRETARLVVGADRRPWPELRQKRVLSVDDLRRTLESVHILSNTVEVPYVLADVPALISDRPRGARRGQRRGGNSWD